MKPVEARDAMSSGADTATNESAHYGTLPIALILDKSISRPALVYYAFLASVSYTHKGVSWYSQENAAKRLGVSRKSVNRYALELERAGWITRTFRGYLSYTTIVTKREGAEHRASDEFHTRRLDTARTDKEIWDKSVPPLGTEVSHDMGQKCPSIMKVRNEMKMKNKVDDLKGRRRSEGEEVDLSALADKTGARAEEVHRQRMEKKQYDRKTEARRAYAKRSITRWRGTKFFEYLLTLCAEHDVKVADAVIYSQGVPPKYAKAMNEVLDAVHQWNVDNHEFARILENLVSQWDNGARDVFSRDGALSVFSIRRNLEKVINTYGGKPADKPATPSPRYKTPEELFGNVEKKEEEK